MTNSQRHGLGLRAGGRGGGEEGIKHRVSRGKTTTTQGETRKVRRKFILRQELFSSQSMRNHGLVKLDFWLFLNVSVVFFARYVDGNLSITDHIYVTLTIGNKKKTNKMIHGPLLCSTFM